MTGFLIRLLMQSHGLTPALLAARANVKDKSLLAILAGSKEPTTRELMSLARALNVPTVDLAPLPVPALESLAEWRELRESLYLVGTVMGWKPIRDYLVVMKHAWGREIARLKTTQRRA